MSLCASASSTNLPTSESEGWFNLWRQVQFLVLHEGSVTRIDGFFDGVNTPSALLKEKLSLEREDDVEVVVLLSASFVAGIGGRRRRRGLLDGTNLGGRGDYCRGGRGGTMVRGLIRGSGEESHSGEESEIYEE